MTHACPQNEAVIPNPIELAEEIMLSRELPFERPIDDELIAEMEGRWCHYRLWLSWEETMGALVVTSSYDLKIPVEHRPQIYALLVKINENVLLGHFDMLSGDGSICYRYAQLVKEPGSMNAEFLEQIIDISLCECERFYPALQSALWGGKDTAQALQLAVMETLGNA